MASPIFTEVRNWLEVLYFASGLVVMILIGFGLRQITLAKHQIETSKDIFKKQSRRESVEAAILEVRRFSETVVQDALAIDKYVEDNHITYFNDIEIQSSDKGFNVIGKKLKKDDIAKFIEIEPLINKFVNGLEAYALFILSGVADEKISFHSNSKTFIELAERAFKITLCTNTDQEDMKPIKSLYFIWKKKAEANKLKIQKEKIENQLSGYNEFTIKSIDSD